MGNLNLLKIKDEGDTLRKVSVIDRVCHKWKKIAALLGFDHLVIGCEREYNHNPQDCCYSIFKEWINCGCKDYPPSYEGLFVLLDDLEFGVLLDTIKKCELPTLSEKQLKEVSAVTSEDKGACALKTEIREEEKPKKKPWYKW